MTKAQLEEQREAKWGEIKDLERLVERCYDDVDEIDDQLDALEDEDGE